MTPIMIVVFLFAILFHNICQWCGTKSNSLPLGACIGAGGISERDTAVGDMGDAGIEVSTSCCEAEACLVL